MSKVYYKKKIAEKREEIVSLRAKILKIKDEKKRRITYLTQSIKNTSSASSKESYRKQKISESEKFAREVDSLKSKIESVKHEIEGYKSSLASIK